MFRKVSVVCGLLFLLIGTAFVADSFYSTVSAQTDKVKAVTNVLTREAQTVEKGDLAALDKIWANSENVSKSQY